MSTKKSSIVYGSSPRSPPPTLPATVSAVDGVSPPLPAAVSAVDGVDNIYLGRVVCVGVCEVCPALQHTTFTEACSCAAAGARARRGGCPSITYYSTIVIGLGIVQSGHCMELYTLGSEALKPSPVFECGGFKASRSGN